MQPRTCGECEYFVRTLRGEEDGVCRTFVKLSDGANYHPIRESNRCACGFFKPADRRG